MNPQMNTTGDRTLRIGDDVLVQIRELAHEARSIWRREPAGIGRAHTHVMRDLAAVRLDLEALERRCSRATPGVEQERELHDCASRLERLRLHWRGIDS